MSAGSRYKIAVLHQGCVPVYRRGFFERLCEVSGNEYVVFHGEPPSNTSLQAASPPFSFENVEVKNRELRLGNSVAVYQPVVWRYITGGFDGAVIGHEFKFLSSLAILFLSKLMGRKVVWWGFGYRKAYGSWQKSGLSGLKDGLARWAADFLAKLGSGYLAYTAKGAEYLQKIGVPDAHVAVVRNTMDVDEQILLAEEVASLGLAELCEEFGLFPDSHVLLYVGRLVPRKRVDLLISFAMSHPQVAGRPVEALIVGDGEERARLEALAQGAGNVHFLGAIDPSDIRIAKAMKLSAAVVVPGYLGLAVNHAFAHGRPVVTLEHDFHSPEVEYLSNGENGLMIPGGEEGFAAGLAAFLSSPDEQSRLSQGAKEARESLRLDHMVEAYDGFLTRLFSERRRG